MLIRTHFAITMFFVLLFLNSVNDKVLFVVVALVATLIPDVDSRFSTIGRRKIARILQWITKHRGVIHSFSFLILIVIGILIFYPKIALGFFLGYGLHLFADSFTIEGIQPFYPYRKKAKGFIRSNGKSEVIVFIIFVIGSLGLLAGIVL